MWRPIPAYWKRRIQASKERRASILRDHTEGERERQEAKDDEYRKQIRDAIQNVSTHIDEAKHQYASDEQRKFIWERRRLWLDVSGIVVAAAAATFLLMQQHAMRGQLEEMQSEQRPWIGTTARPEGAITISGQWIHPEILIPIKNFGHSPAFHVSSQTEAMGFEEAAKDYANVKGPKAMVCVLSEAAAITADKVPEEPDYGFAIFPEIPSRIGNRVLTPITYSFPTEQQLAVIGCIAYTDQLHQSGTPIHHTWFCFMSNDPIKNFITDGAIHLERAGLFTCAFFQGAD
jgi:hypothetical protein